MFNYIFERIREENRKKADVRGSFGYGTLEKLSTRRDYFMGGDLFFLRDFKSHFLLH